MSKLIRNEFAIVRKNKHGLANLLVQFNYLALLLTILICTKCCLTQNYNENQQAKNNKPALEEQKQQVSRNDAFGRALNNEICCPCDEAKYELIFEGLWSKYTHPDEFPENEMLAYFGDIIGASHSDEVRMWEPGSMASEGVKELAESGSTKRLEAELKLVSPLTRTIIKARELRYPTLNSKTSAVVRADKRNHLVSILSKLGPSADLMVGVSALNLCQADCTWSAQKIVNLFPWDAGLDSSETFAKQLRANSTSPQEPIKPYRRQSLSASYLMGASKMQAFQRENNNFVALDNAAESSFSLDQSKPFARLTITRQRVYEKSCNHSEQQATTQPGYYVTIPNNELNLSSSSKIQANQANDSSNNNNQWPTSNGRVVTLPAPPNMIDCRYTNWSDWTSCSSSCGKGTRTRTRSFKNDRYAQTGCSLSGLVEKEFCLAECRGNNGTCITRDWSSWSRCSVDCGQGRRKRTRSIIGPRSASCELIDLVEEEPCIGMGDCSGIGTPSNHHQSGRNNNHRHNNNNNNHQHQASSFVENEDNVNCGVSPWSAWTECSRHPCGGTRIRTRKLMHPENMAKCKMQFIQKRQCPVNAELCRQTFADVATICNSPADEGPCHGDFTRWYYDNSTLSCNSFTFKGCAGNQNNFDTFQDCEHICLKPMRRLQPNGDKTPTRKDDVNDDNSNSNNNNNN